MASPYHLPAVTDHGTLEDLTASLEHELLGPAFKLVAASAVSVPIGGSQTPSSGGTLNNSSTGGVPNTVLPGSGSTPGSGTLPANAVSPTTPTVTPGNGVLHDTAAGNSTRSLADPPAGAAAGADAGGKLPFTGLYIMVLAGFGAAFAGTGVAIRSKLRRLT